MNYDGAFNVKDLAAPVNEVLKRLEWEWTPQRGEWWFRPGTMVNLIENPELISSEESTIWFDATPILEWEEIERILHKAGYVLRGSEFYQIGTDYFPAPDHRFSINKYGQMIVIAEGNSRQEAVMKAVIELGKEMK